MDRNLFFLVLAFAVLALALGGWTVQGLRWTFAAPVRAFS
jgi:hypothetical protein